MKLIIHDSNIKYVYNILNNSSMGFIHYLLYDNGNSVQEHFHKYHDTLYNRYLKFYEIFEK
jgi:two-component sensor histidine kinase